MRCFIKKKALDFKRGSLYAVVGCLLLIFPVQSAVVKTETTTNEFQNRLSSDLNCTMLLYFDENKTNGIMLYQNETQLCFTSDAKLDFPKECKNFMILIGSGDLCLNRKQTRTISKLVVHCKGKLCVVFPLLAHNIDSERQQREFYLNGHKLLFKFLCMKHLLCHSLRNCVQERNEPKNRQSLCFDTFIDENPERHLLPASRRLFDKCRMLYFKAHNISVTRNKSHSSRYFKIKVHKLKTPTLHWKNCLRLRQMRNVFFNNHRAYKFMKDLSISEREGRRVKREASDSGTTINQQQEPTATVTNDVKTISSPSKIKHKKVHEFWRQNFNATAYRLYLEKREQDRKIRIEAQWAYVCLVLLILLIVLAIWCLRGFHSRNANKKLVTFSDKDQYLTVKEVMYRKALYLPMFNHQGPLEEVLIHDCGTNTDSF